MTTEELIEALDQRYGNPHAKDCELIQEAIQQLKNYDMMFTTAGMEKLNEGSTGHRDEQSA